MDLSQLSINERACYNGAVAAIQQLQADWTPAELMAFCEIESSFNPRSYRYEPRLREGSYGVMQTLLSTARSVGFKGNALELFTPATSIYYGLSYLQTITDQIGDALGGDHPYDSEIIGAYNGGPGLVINHVRRTNDDGTIPGAVAHYVDVYNHALSKWQLLTGSP